jgi:hypothetical protein
VRSNRGQKHGMPPSHDPADQTRRVQLPDETGPVPVSVAYAQTRWFGVPSPFVLLGVAVGSFLLAIALLAAGSWALGLFLLGLSALVTAAFLEVARRRPESDWLRSAHSWTSSRLELVRAHTKAVAEVQRLRGSLAVIESERRAALLRLGEAERSEDGEAAETARERLRALERAEEALHGREESEKAQAGERIRRARFSSQQTMVVEPEEDSGRPAA